MSKEIFALDIGTRKVMGIVARKAEEFIEILDVEMIEHTNRAMFDGQIHSIEEVARTVRKVKENLESRLNMQLAQVGVAVAGRNLLTYKSKVDKGFDPEQEVTRDMIRNLELEAVDKIISDSGKNLSDFYCVGYSPVYYELDGNRISDLLGHKAKKIACEVIVTLLPRVVLDSMFAVLKRAELEPTNITLEPISAINAIVPPEMRRLNIILVDIGAGTSDLALTKDGFVFAYGMVSEAGDEITEWISEVLLVDFSTAEEIKKSMHNKDSIEYDDIWSRHHSIDSCSLKEKLLPGVKKLASSIARLGLDLNEGAPQAVVAVGGGSLTPGLIQELSTSFGIPIEKVGIRLPSVIKTIKDKTKKLNGPEAVTPIGITQMTLSSQGLRFIDIEINGKKLKLLDFEQKKDVMGALTFSGIINNKKLYPRPGMALTVEVNSELKVIKGTFGVPARVTLNSSLVYSLSDRIENNDKIEFQEAIDGENAEARVRDCVGELKPVPVVFNQQALEAYPPVIMNGLEANLNLMVPDRAVIETSSLRIKDVLKSSGVKIDNLTERQILVNINGVPKILTQRNFTLRLNGNYCDLNSDVNKDDIIEFVSDSPTFFRIKDIVESLGGADRMRINVDGNDIDIMVEPIQVFMNGQQVRPEEFLIDGADIKVYYVDKRQVLLSEIFKYIQLDPCKGLGKRIRILVNDNPAGFTTPLSEGSRVRIIFEDRE